MIGAQLSSYTTGLTFHGGGSTAWNLMALGNDNGVMFRVAGDGTITFANGAKIIPI